MRPGRDRIEHVASKIMGAPSEVIDRNNSDHRLVSIHNRQPPHTFLLHQPSRIRAILILETRCHSDRHDRSRGRLCRTLACPNGTTTDVAIRDHADRLAVLQPR
jgi:hypothetical protein